MRHGPENLFERMFPATGELSLAIVGQQEVPRQVRRASCGTQGVPLLKKTGIARQLRRRERNKRLVHLYIRAELIAIQRYANPITTRFLK